MEKALVTGGCGFVGRHLAQSLLNDGAEVWVLDNLFSGAHPREWLSEWTETSAYGQTAFEKDGRRLVFLRADAIDFFRDQCAGRGAALPPFDEAYHLAAVVGGRAVLIENNPMLVATNHIIDSLFFQWLVGGPDRARRTLYVSTSVAYPKTMQDRGSHVAMKEPMLDLLGADTIGLPESIYGWIKLAGEYLATVAAKRYGAKVVCVRPFSGYGEDQDFSYPVPSIAGRAVRREDPLIVWGSGDQGRDFIYIDDFVSALRIAIRAIGDGSAVNIGMGQLVTFKEVARLFAELAGYAPEIRGQTDKVEGSFAVYADTARLRSIGWSPRTTLREGFAKVLARVERHIAEEEKRSTRLA